MLRPMPSTSIDVERARADTPGCATVAHLNNAGASLAPTPVLDAVIDHLRREATIGGYEAAAEAAERIDAVYESIAGLLGGRASEIALVESATRAWDMAFYALGLGEGDRVLTANAEYASNMIAMLQLAAERGVVVDVAPDDEHGQVDVDALAAMVDERTRVIALTHVPTSGGLVNPAAAVGEVARAAGVPYLLDACQSVGQLPVDVDVIGCDFLAATGRKFLRAPRGTGLLYVRQHWIERLSPPFLDLHAASWVAPSRYEVRRDARRFESWEASVAGRLGLGAAVDYALGWGLPAIAERVGSLAQTLRSQLAALAGVEVHDRGVERCGIVTFTVDGWAAADVADVLRAAAVNVSVSTIGQARLDFSRRGLEALVRASIHYYNVDAELDRLCEVVGGLRSR